MKDKDNKIKELKADEAEDILKKRTELSILYDFYGPLLKDFQREIFELYIMEDYGFSEIAKELNKSRQAVYDTIKRVSEYLVEYEKKLGLVERFDNEKKIIDKTRDIIFELDESNFSDSKARILELIERLDS
ncbi:MAG: YlxM family DNA-binding protein [Lachnospiraceae bacterium]|nr:YlxM family DNA-binding protein [Lachnospiraceae bacterium]